MTSDTVHRISTGARAFLFDVFGTCVDWRKSVTDALHEAATKTLSDSSSTISPSVRRVASQYTKDTWGDFAQQWRTTYYDFTRGLAKDPTSTWKTVDQHNLDSLRAILLERGLIHDPNEGTSGNFWTDDEIMHLSTVWHRLSSWLDTNSALNILGRTYATATLSNGNMSLLHDMQTYSGMEFTHTFSSELFGSYKPNPAIYHGAAERLGLRPEQCVMVAAHLGDLEGAKACGFWTVYVERPREETGDVEAARKKGFVDLWVAERDGGFLGMCRALGLGDQ